MNCLDQEKQSQESERQKKARKAKGSLTKEELEEIREKARITKQIIRNKRSRQKILGEKRNDRAWKRAATTMKRLQNGKRNTLRQMPPYSWKMVILRLPKQLSSNRN